MYAPIVDMSASAASRTASACATFNDFDALPSYPVGSSSQSRTTFRLTLSRRCARLIERVRIDRRSCRVRVARTSCCGWCGWLARGPPARQRRRAVGRRRSQVRASSGATCRDRANVGISAVNQRGVVRE
jgi:hypothetical protein